MTGRQEYDRTKDRQRILDEYMIDFQESNFIFPNDGLENISSIQNYQGLFPQLGSCQVQPCAN
jgi:hypothetical protein